jgi:antitoxin Phd
MSQVINSTEAKKHFGDLLLNVIKEPVIIKRHNKKFAVMMSYEEYQRIEELEDYVLGKMAEESEKNGEFLSVDESEKFMMEWDTEIQKHKSNN